MSAPRRACALYTRKSSEEGLEQAFNSLDAQREACEAYVKSQAHEGWRTLPARYDDGGVSGGTLERPALQRLLADIEAGRIAVVVVYKIDRLTRSLADFVRIVEIFDRRGVSFVSVTQAFNTTTSMGRLTLNMLLSFAQFEREVTGERIRDKIAASKARGMWMGGLPPLGYDPPRGPERALCVNDAEAATVVRIFRDYLALGSVHGLEQALAAAGVRSKPRPRPDGSLEPGRPFSRGALFHLLRNPVYRGQIRHKGALHPGRHQPIVAADLFDEVQAHLARQARRGPRPATADASGAGGTDGAGSTGGASGRAVLAGRIFDADGHRMSPASARGRGGRLYRYYVSAPLQQGLPRASAPGLGRVPAGLLETRVADRLRALAGCDPTDPLARLARIEVRADRLCLDLPAAERRALAADPVPGEVLAAVPGHPHLVRLVIPFALARRGYPLAIVRGPLAGPRPDPVLVRALRRAHRLVGRDRDGLPRLEAAPATPYLQRLVRLAFLAPDLQAAILAGRQPADLTLARLLKAEIPVKWEDQRRCFGPVVPGT